MYRYDSLCSTIVKSAMKLGPCNIRREITLDTAQRERVSKLVFYAQSIGAVIIIIIIK